MLTNESYHGKHCTTDKRFKQKEAKEVQVLAANTIIHDVAIYVQII